MKPCALIRCLLLNATAVALLAQAPPPAPTAPRPARRRAPMFMPVRSPEVSADRRVTFRLRAPQAKSVRVLGQWPDGHAAMTEDGNGVWSVTLGPIEPGVWEYSFQVDGLTMIDPGNRAIKPMREPRTSILDIPGNPPLIWDFRNVPHGVVRLHTYWSQPLHRLRGLVVYTPPGYDQHPDARYPTLYLQHGYGDTQKTWTVHGHANWILDNLIAEGRAKPMIIVMMDGHAALPVGGRDYLQRNTTLFEQDLFKEVMPFVQKHYRIKPGADNRAIVGLSMGGGQALTIGLNHPDRFAWVGGFSSAVPSAEAIASALADPAGINQKLRLLWIGDGQDFLRRANERFIALLKQKGIHYEWHPTAGGHEWPVWRNYLAELAPKLFQ